MHSRIFLAKVDAIESCIEKALPKIKSIFGDNLTTDLVRDTIGTRKLLQEATNACLRDSAHSIRGTPISTELWIDILTLYKTALVNNSQNKDDGMCENHGVIPYSHGFCPYCTK